MGLGRTIRRGGTETIDCQLSLETSLAATPVAAARPLGVEGRLPYESDVGPLDRLEVLWQWRHVGELKRDELLHIERQRVVGPAFMPDGRDRLSVHAASAGRACVVSRVDLNIVS